MASSLYFCILSGYTIVICWITATDDLASWYLFCIFDEHLKTTDITDKHKNHVKPNCISFTIIIKVQYNSKPICCPPVKPKEILALHKKMWYQNAKQPFQVKRPKWSLSAISYLAIIVLAKCGKFHPSQMNSRPIHKEMLNAVWLVEHSISSKTQFSNGALAHHHYLATFCTFLLSLLTGIEVRFVRLVLADLRINIAPKRGGGKLM